MLQELNNKGFNDVHCINIKRQDSRTPQKLSGLARFLARRSVREVLECGCPLPLLHVTAQIARHLNRIRI